MASGSQGKEVEDWHFVELNANEGDSFSSPSLSPSPSEQRADMLANEIITGTADFSHDETSELEDITAMQHTPEVLAIQEEQKSYSWPHELDSKGEVLQKLSSAQLGSEAEGSTQADEEPEVEWPSLGDVAGGLREGVQGALAALLHLASTAVAHLGAATLEARRKMGQAAESACQVALKVLGTVKSRRPRGMALVSLTLLASLALAGLAAQLSANKRLARQVHQRDRELARLFMKILHLQESLSGTSSLVVRHTALEGSLATSSFL